MPNSFSATVLPMRQTAAELRTSSDRERLAFRHRPVAHSEVIRRRAQNPADPPVAISVNDLSPAVHAGSDVLQDTALAAESFRVFHRERGPPAAAPELTPATETSAGSI